MDFCSKIDHISSEHFCFQILRESAIMIRGLICFYILHAAQMMRYIWSIALCSAETWTIQKR